MFCLLLPAAIRAQAPPASPDPVQSGGTTSSGISDDRILGVIPNFQTVSDPEKPYVPLRIRDKWLLFAKESADPYTFGMAAAGAALSQWHNNDPKYGYGYQAYFQRFGAAQADVTSQNFFSDAVLASLLHEDPRYFRMGPGNTVIHRIFYAISRVAITRKDSGKDGFSVSGVVGTGMGIALSNAYYPPASRTGAEMGYRLFSSFTSSALGNLLPEFWPDVRQKLAHYRHQ
jgi:hypothetical protein